MKSKLPFVLNYIDTSSSELQTVTLFQGVTIDVYPGSIHRYNNSDFFIGIKEGKKCLFCITDDSNRCVKKIDAEYVYYNNNSVTILQCPLSHDNAKVIRKYFDHTRPRLIGIDNSFGLGDRIGLANPGHVRAIQNSGFKAILAQQSIRELNRTNRTPDEVIDAATWAVFQEGYTEGFGADADHLKTTGDIDRMVKAGFTMFTIDPSDFVVNEAALLTEDELSKRGTDIRWDVLQDTYENVVRRFADETITVDPAFSLTPSKKEVLQAIVKYGNVIAHIVQMNNHLETKHPRHPSEIEVSVDETDSPTTPFENYFIASELRRLGVKLVSLAPRFIGDFEKGIDYRGDIQAFTEEYKKHIAIAGKLGPYKISIHSGSDKFTVYRAIGRIGRGRVHIKTAGTSYLEALRVVAFKEPELFRSIYSFSLDNFTNEKQTYHVSGKLENVPAADSLNDDEFMKLFKDDDARQVLHVSFGKVLTEKNKSGEFVFKDKIITCLGEFEELHYQFIEEHFRRHIEPFGFQESE